MTFTIKAGFKLLHDAVAKEPPRSKRWFYLESVVGAAALRSKSLQPIDGVQAYSAMFDEAQYAPAVGALYVLRQSVGEYVSAIGGPLRWEGYAHDTRIQQVLVKAWSAYVICIRQTGADARFRTTDPPWAEAIDVADVGDLLMPEVEKALKDGSVPPNYGVFIAGAAVYLKDKPDQALSLLLQAEPLLPTSNLYECAGFYDTLVDLLVARGKMPEAIAKQQKRIDLTKHGQAKLALLNSSIGDTKGFQTVFLLLTSPGADEREVNELAEALLMQDARKTDDLKEKEASTLLVNYLSAARTRSVEQELRARLLLGSLLMNQNRIKDASAVVAVDKLGLMPKSAAARHYYALIKQINDSLTHQTSHK